VPGETLLLVAGVLVGQGHLGGPATYAAAITGAVVGITISYAVGRAIGVRVLHRYGHRLHIESSNVEHVREFFGRSGKWALMFGYFVPGIRHLTALVAGAAEVSLALFTVYAYAGAFLWAVAFITLGLYVGDKWEQIAARIQTSSLFVAAAIAVVAAVAFLLHRTLRKPGDGTRGHRKM
jgi:membrane protein DedA with SNARE-associated domain